MTFSMQKAEEISGWSSAVPKSAHGRIFRLGEDKKIGEEVIAVTEDGSVKGVAEGGCLLQFFCLQACPEELDTTHREPFW